jgi:hypothetical protein
MAFLGQLAPRGSFGQTLGESLGTGLSSGLQALAQQRLGEIQQRASMGRNATGLQSLGFQPEQAQSLAGLPESILKEITKQHLLGPQQEAYGQALNQLLGNKNESIANEGQPAVNQQQPQPKPRLNEQQATKLAEISLRKNEQQQKAQQHVDKLAAPIFKEIKENGVPSRKIVKLATDIKDLLKTNKALTGVAGRLTPKELQTPEGQVLLAKINDLVLQKAQLGKGVPSKLRLTLEELAKPAIWQKPKAILKLVNDIADDPELQRFISLDEAREKLVQENEFLPRNFESLIEKEAKQIRKGRKQETSLKSLQEALPAKDHEGEFATNPETGERAQSVNGKWVKVGE